MMFTANLAVALWLLLKQKLQGQRHSLSEAADEFSRNEAKDETIAIETLNKTLNKSENADRRLWHWGLGTGLTAMLYLYFLRLHGESWPEQLCQPWIFLLAAYLSPCLMALMTLIVYYHNRNAEHQKARLQDRVDNLRTQQTATRSNVFSNLARWFESVPKT